MYVWMYSVEFNDAKCFLKYTPSCMYSSHSNTHLVWVCYCRNYNAKIRINVGMKCEKFALLYVKNQNRIKFNVMLSEILSFQFSCLLGEHSPNSFQCCSCSPEHFRSFTGEGGGGREWVAKVLKIFVYIRGMFRDKTLKVSFFGIENNQSTPDGEHGAGHNFMYIYAYYIYQWFFVVGK